MLSFLRRFVQIFFVFTKIDLDRKFLLIQMFNKKLYDWNFIFLRKFINRKIFLRYLEIFSMRNLNIDVLKYRISSNKHRLLISAALLTLTPELAPPSYKRFSLISAAPQLAMFIRNLTTI